MTRFNAIFNLFKAIGGKGLPNFAFDNENRTRVKKEQQTFDVVVLGSGINGGAIAAELADNGLKVLVCDKGRIAGCTSSNSTSIIHGGLRYLPQHEYLLVKKALDERQTLVTNAPHLVQQMSFVMPHQKSDEYPSWLVNAGLILYDNLSRRNSLPKSRAVNRNKDLPYFSPLKDEIESASIYSDARTDDARLTITKAIQARESGALILPLTEMIEGLKIGDCWHLTLQPQYGEKLQVRAKVVINATGPYVESVAQLMQTPLQHKVALVKGSHIIVPKLYEGEHAYLLQNDDKRVIFALPFHGHTLIGTTDIPFLARPETVKIDEHEIDYLLKVVNGFFNRSLDRDNIVRTRSGIRTLGFSAGKNASELSRDYILEFSQNAIHVLGGKVTTHGKLAEDIASLLHPVFPNLQPSKRQTTPLPGAVYKTKTGCMSFPEYRQYAREKYSWLDESILTRYLYSYGTRTENILANCHGINDMGRCFAKSFYQVEVDYLIREEWATDLEGILWLNTKIGLTINMEEKQSLATYLSSHPSLNHSSRNLDSNSWFFGKGVKALVEIPSSNQNGRHTYP
jgi:glycerol-3-phosphate dehydrogenase